MARQKVCSALTLHSWQEVNEALRQIGENRRDIAAIESVMNKRIADAKATADAKARPILPRGAEKHKAILSELLRRGMAECVVYPEPKIDKDALKKYSVGEISDVGAKLEVEDVFGYEVNEEVLAE